MSPVIRKWGASRQMTPRVLTEAPAVGGDEAKSAFEAMITITEINFAVIEPARVTITGANDQITVTATFPVKGTTF